MDTEFNDVRFTPSQAGLLESAQQAQELANKQKDLVSAQIYQVNQQIKDFQKEIMSKESELNALQAQLKKLNGLPNMNETAVNTVLAEYKIVPPYQVTFIYDKGKPVGIRFPKAGS